MADRSRSRFGFLSGLALAAGWSSKPRAGDLFVPPPAPNLTQARVGVTEHLRVAAGQLLAVQDQSQALTGTSPGVALLIQTLEAILGSRLQPHCTVWDFVRNSTDTMAEDSVQLYANAQAEEQVSALAAASWAVVAAQPGGAPVSRSRRLGRLWLLRTLTTRSLYDALASLTRRGVTQRYYAENAVLRTSDPANSFLYGVLYELLGLRFDLGVADVDLISYDPLPLAPEAEFGPPSPPPAPPAPEPSPVTPVDPSPESAQPNGPVVATNPQALVPWHRNKAPRLNLVTAVAAAAAGSAAAAAITAARARELTHGGQLPSSFDPRTLDVLPEAVVAMRRPAKRTRRRRRSIEPAAIRVEGTAATDHGTGPSAEASLGVPLQHGSDHPDERSDGTASVYSDAHRTQPRSSDHEGDIAVPPADPSEPVQAPEAEASQPPPVPQDSSAVPMDVAASTKSPAIPIPTGVGTEEDAEPYVHGSALSHALASYTPPPALTAVIPDPHAISAIRQIANIPPFDPPVSSAPAQPSVQPPSVPSPLQTSPPPESHAPSLARGERDAELLSALERVMQRLGNVYDDVATRGSDGLAPTTDTDSLPAAQLQQVQELLAALTASPPQSTPGSATGSRLTSSARSSPCNESHAATSSAQVASSPAVTPRSSLTPPEVPCPPRGSGAASAEPPAPRSRLPRLSFDPLGPAPQAFEAPPPSTDVARPEAAARRPSSPRAPDSTFSERELGKLLSAAAIMKTELEIGTRVSRNRSYGNAFYGHEAVTFLVDRKLAQNREDAVILGLWLEQAGMFHHVRDKWHFQDRDLVFRFYNDERDTADESPCASPLPFVSPLVSRSPASPNRGPSSSSTPKKFGEFEMTYLRQCIQTLEALPQAQRLPEFQLGFEPRNGIRGSSVVSCLVTQGFAESRLEAVELGRKLEALGWLQPVDHRDGFQDGPQAYTICRPKDGAVGAAGGVFMSRVSSASSIASTAFEWTEAFPNSALVQCEGYLQQLCPRLLTTATRTYYFVLCGAQLQCYASKEDCGRPGGRFKFVDLQQVVVSRPAEADMRCICIERINEAKAYRLVCPSVAEADMWHEKILIAAVRAGRSRCATFQTMWEVQRWSPLSGWTPAEVPADSAFRAVHDFSLLERWVAQIGYSWVGEWRPTDADATEDPEGWRYASGFVDPAQFQLSKSTTSFVRARQWTRRCAPPPAAGPSR